MKNRTTMFSRRSKKEQNVLIIVPLITLNIDVVIDYPKKMTVLSL